MNRLSFHFPHINGVEIGIDNSFPFQLVSRILAEAFHLHYNGTAKNRKQTYGKLNGWIYESDGNGEVYFRLLVI